MLAPQDFLQTTLRILRRLGECRQATLYVPLPVTPVTRPILLHDGEGPAAPELVEAEAASSFHRAHLEDGVAGSPWSGSDPVTWLPSADPEVVLVRVPALESLGGSTVNGPERRRLGTSGGDSGVAWLGLRSPELRSRLESKDETATGLTPVLVLASSVAWHGRWLSTIVLDPVSQLPGRSEVQAVLRQLRTSPSARDEVTAMFLVNPDNFGAINERLGRAAGDSVIREIARRLRDAVRSTDFVYRYGAAVFGVLLTQTNEDGCEQVAKKLHDVLTREPYLSGAVRLQFSIGVALDGTDRDGREAGDGELDAARLTRRADRALSGAKRIGGGGIRIVRPGDPTEDTDRLDRLEGIFTADPSTDYQRMLLIWEVVSIMARSTEPRILKTRFLEALSRSLQADRVALFQHVAGDQGERVLEGAALDSLTSGQTSWVWGYRPTDQEAALLHATEAGSELVLRECSLGGRGEPVRKGLACAVPLVAGDERSGFLYVAGREDLMRLHASDRGFLDSLGRQLAVALDRARLVQDERERQDRARETLEAEIRDLQQTLGRTRLVHRSAVMQELLHTVQRVARTEATVLINGESGTGKEVLARTLHDLSPRRDRPFVVVDCTAIAPTLIESELFGHERGAFTGADRASQGRLAEAQRGTVLLDEIAELTPEIQSKLLRFVQDRQYTPVGGNKPRELDVRVIAATHRDLAKDVDAGRFREDLFHRLNVVRLVVPPLRERPDDIVHLMQYFLDQYTEQHGKQAMQFTQDALEAGLRHEWPGNVRELQNRVMRAVVFCPGDRIHAADLEIQAGSPGNAVSARPYPPPSSPAEVSPSPGPGAPAPGAPPEAEPPAADPWRDLLGDLERRIDVALSRGVDHPPPLARWVADDFVLEAYRAAGETSCRAAEILGIPETTYRRRRGKILAQSVSGEPERPEQWGAVRERVRQIVSGCGGDGRDLLSDLRDAILRVVSSKPVGSDQVGSAFMGVTPPTYRRWLSTLRDAGVEESGVAG